MGYLKFTSSLVVSWPRPRLVYLKFYGLVVSISKVWCFLDLDLGWDASSFVASWSRSRLGHVKLYGFMVKMPVGRPQVLWFGGLDPGWDTSSFAASWSSSRLGYLKLYRPVVKIPVRIPQVWLRSQDLGWDISNFVVSRLGQSKFYDFIIKISNGIPHVSSFHNEDPVRIPKILRFRVQDYGWGSSNFVSS